MLNREGFFLEMTGLATPNFLTNAKFEIKCCIVFVFLPSSFVTFWFCFVKPWEGLLGDDRISNPKFLDQCKIWNKVLYCIRLSSVVLRFVTFWFCFIKLWEGLLGNDRISNPKFLDQCKIWNKCCIVCVFLPSSFVHNASELSLNYKFLFFPFQFTRLKLYY